MDVKGKNVFLSGPMTGRDHNNLLAFLDAHQKLNELGAKYVFNPTFQWCVDISHGKRQKSHEHYMRKCIAQLTHSNSDGERYDLLVSLPGWQDSEGATVEREVAAALGIPTFEMVSDDEGEGGTDGE